MPKRWSFVSGPLSLGWVAKRSQGGARRAEDMSAATQPRVSGCVKNAPLFGEFDPLIHLSYICSN